MTIWFVLLSAGIKTSAFQMSKFRGSITLSIFSLSTLSNYHYWQSPKTRYWRLVRPYQTGIPPARLLALVWAHNSDLYHCSYSLLYQISPTNSIASWLKILHSQTILLCKMDGFSAVPPVIVALIRQVHRPILLRNPR